MADQGAPHGLRRRRRSAATGHRHPRSTTAAGERDESGSSAAAESGIRIPDVYGPPVFYGGSIPEINTTNHGGGYAHWTARSGVVPLSRNCPDRAGDGGRREA